VRVNLNKTGRVLLRWLPALLLAAPSVWMLASVPPLWRDVDGYNQVTLPPGGLTILNFSPLYCFGARIPLYAGCAWGSLLAHTEWPGWGFFSHPILTDHGVLFLVALQHLLLLGAQMFLLRMAGKTLLVRISIAALLALNSSFYTFAHSIGTEAVALSATLWLIGCSVRVFVSPAIRRADWVWFAVSLTICVLLRHINAVLAALLPLAYLFRGGAGIVRATVRRKAAAFPRRFVRRELTRAALSVIVALLCLAVASRTVRYIARSARIHDRSTMGSVFVYARMNFLLRLDPAQRAALLTRLADRTGDPVLKRMLLASPSGISETGEWNAARYLQDLVRIMQESGVRQGLDYELDKRENQLAKIFLFSFEHPFLRVVADDFFAAGRMSIPELATFPFATTQYCFSRMEKMPQLTTLATFKGNSAEAVLATEEQKRYYRWMEFSFWQALGGWFAITLLCRIFLRGAAKAVIALSAAFVGVGLAMLFLICLLSEVLPRFLLPSWSLLFVAALLSLGRLAEIPMKRLGAARA
jgi:hypothetical protein